MTSSQLAVITINHHHAEPIKKMIESLYTSTKSVNFRTFLVNNTPDEIIENWLNENFPDVRIYENTKPRGFAENINQMILEHPSFDYYLLLNPDVICLPGMIENLITVMEKDVQIGVVGPRLLNFDGSVQPSRRRFASFRVLIYRALHLDKVIKNLPAVNHYLMINEDFDSISEVDWVTGAIMLLRKKALDDVGLLDERFFLYFEDEDLCCRMWQKGWKVCYLTEATAYHAHMAEGRNKIFSKANLQHILSAIKMFIKYRGRISNCSEDISKNYN